MIEVLEFSDKNKYEKCLEKKIQKSKQISGSILKETTIQKKLLLDKIKHNFKIIMLIEAMILEYAVLAKEPIL